MVPLLGSLLAQPPLLQKPLTHSLFGPAGAFTWHPNDGRPVRRSKSRTLTRVVCGETSGHFRRAGPSAKADK